MLYPLRCNSSTNFILIDRSSRYSLFSIQPLSNPPDHRLLCRCSSFPSSFSLHKERFTLEAQALVDFAPQVEVAEEDQGLERKTKKNKKISSYLASLVKVFCTSRPGYFTPFRGKRLYTSSGFIVEGRKVVTCAHSVNNHTKVQLKKPNSHTLYVATVLAVALECDLALLTVNDDKFWEGIVPVEFGDVPAPKDKLAIMGYPDEKFSIITTCVSRVGMVYCASSKFEHLCVEVDIALRKGTSGGPVFNRRGKCVGMAFQTGDRSDILAAPVIDHVLQDYYKNEAYTGFPQLCIVWQQMTNPDLRLFMKMGHDQQGVLIMEVKPNYPEYEILKPNDIILSIDGIDIDNYGKVPFRWGQRIPFSYILTQKYVGDSADIKVLRDSEIQTHSIKLTTHKQFKPANISGMHFPYYIIAGFVFTTLSVPYIFSEYGYPDKYIRMELLWQAKYEERVVISKVLKCGARNGYDDMEYLENAQVLAVNGMPVQSLKSLACIVESCNEEFLEFILDKQKVVLIEVEASV